MSIFTTLFYVPIYYSSVIGLTPTENGLRLVPNFFGVSFGSVGAGIYMKNWSLLQVGSFSWYFRHFWYWQNSVTYS